MSMPMRLVTAKIFSSQCQEITFFGLSGTHAFSFNMKFGLKIQWVIHKWVHTKVFFSSFWLYIFVTSSSKKANESNTTAFFHFLSDDLRKSLIIMALLFFCNKIKKAGYNSKNSKKSTFKDSTMAKMTPI